MSSFNRRQVLGTAAAAGATLAAPPVLARAKVTLRIANFASDKTPVASEVLVPWMERIKAASDGMLDYQVFHGGTLGRNPAEQLKLVRDGIADMAWTVPDYTPGVMPGWGVITIPNLVTDAYEASVALERAMAQGVLEVPDGVVILGAFASDINVLHSAKPVKSLADVAGLRVRAVAKSQLEAVARLGGAPVPNIRGPEVAEGISRGTMDAALVDYGAYAAFRISEVAPHHLEIPMGAVALNFTMNQGTYDGLPDPARAAVDALSGADFARTAGRSMNASSEGFKAIFKDREGDVFTQLDAAGQADFEARLAGIEEAWVEGDATRQSQFDAFAQILSDVRAEA